LRPLTLWICWTCLLVAGCAGEPTAPYTFVVIPDVQNYTKYAKNQANFEEMTRWIVDNQDEYGIVLVLQEGDLVEQNAILESGGPGWGDQTGLEQWTAARRAISVLDGRLPYVLCTGNHDYGIRNSESRQTHFNSFFTPSANPLNSDGAGGGILRGMAANAFGAPTLENAYYELTGPDGRDFLIVVLEWGPRQAVVDWARSIAERPEYADHTAVLLTHTYLSHDDTYDQSPHAYPTGASGDTHGGQELWDELVGPGRNFEMTFNGHVGGDQVGYRVDANAAGRQVHQMLFNAQYSGGGSKGEGNGGDGWMRLVTFEPDGRSVTVRTYSPYLAARGLEAWRTGPADQFRFEVSPLR
jgi:hypothetical protein